MTSPATSRSRSATSLAPSRPPRSGSTPAAASSAPIALDGVAVNTQTPIELTLTCEGNQAPYTAQVLDPRIVAVKLGSATQK